MPYKFVGFGEVLCKVHNKLCSKSGRMDHRAAFCNAPSSYFLCTETGGSPEVTEHVSDCSRCLVYNSTLEKSRSSGKKSA